jgi:hypothetical protein
MQVGWIDPDGHAICNICFNDKYGWDGKRHCDTLMFGISMFPVCSNCHAPLTPQYFENHTVYDLVAGE